jgi:hypothetical protein
MKIEQTQLVGLFFHTFKFTDNELDIAIHWQGIVVGNPQPEWYLVQLFEWMHGTDSNIQLVNIEDMTDWKFYTDKEGFDLGYERIK